MKKKQLTHTAEQIDEAIDKAFDASRDTKAILDSINEMTEDPNTDAAIVAKISANTANIQQTNANVTDLAQKVGETFHHEPSDNWIKAEIDAEGKLYGGINANNEEVRYLPQVFKESIKSPTIDAIVNVVNDAKTAIDDVKKEHATEREKLNDVTDSISKGEDKDYIQVIIDKEDKVVEGICNDGLHKFNCGYKTQSTETKEEFSPKYIHAIVGSNGELIEAININGTKRIGKFDTPTFDMISKGIDLDPLLYRSMHGKSVVVIGSSSALNPQGWSYYMSEFCNKYGLQYINNAYGSSSFVRTTYYIPDGSSRTDSTKYLLWQWNNIKSQITSDEPIVIVETGINAATNGMDAEPPTNQLVDGYDVSIERCYHNTSSVDFENADGTQKELDAAVESFKRILADFPKMKLYIVGTWGQRTNTYKRRQMMSKLREFHLAMCDYFGATFIDLNRSSSVHPYCEHYTPDGGNTYPYRVATKTTNDGVHAYDDPARYNIFSVILSNILQNNLIY